MIVDGFAKIVGARYVICILYGTASSHGWCDKAASFNGARQDLYEALKSKEGTQA